MKCKLCGGEAKELGGNRYRCNYCAHEFEGVIETVNNNTHAHNKSNAESENRGRDFIIGNVLGSQDFVNPPANRSEFLERTSQIYQQLDNAGRSSTTDTSTPNANTDTNTNSNPVSNAGSNPNRNFCAPPEHLELGKDPESALSGEELYDSAIGGVVEIYAYDVEGEGASSSGFAISEKGFVLTNAHAVLNEEGEVYNNIVVKNKDGEFRAFAIAVGKPADGINDSIDLCLLYVHGLNAKPSPLGDVSKIRNGQKVYLIGNSLGSGTCITSGIISDKERAIEGLSYPYIMTDAAANPGNSGGPLYNAYGEIIGVLVAGIDGAKGMNYAIPASIVELFLSFVIQNMPFAGNDELDINQYSKAKTPLAHSFNLSDALSGLKLFIDIALFIMAFF